MQISAVLFTVFCFFSSTAVATPAARHLYEVVTGLNCSQHLEIKAISTDIAEMLDQLAKIKSEILKRYPPDKFQIIGVGQSPSIIIAALQAVHRAYAFNLPLSSFRALIKANGIIINSGIIPPARFYSEEQLQHLRNHFAKFIPASTKDILLIDHTSTGATILSVYYYLKSFLDESGQQRQVSIAALVGSYNRKLIVQDMTINLALLGYFNQTENFASFVISGPLAQIITNKDDRFTISEYGAFNIENLPAHVENSMRYADLAHWLQQLEQ